MPIISDARNRYVVTCQMTGINKRPNSRISVLDDSQYKRFCCHADLLCSGHRKNAWICWKYWSRSSAQKWPSPAYTAHKCDVYLDGKYDCNLCIHELPKYARWTAAVFIIYVMDVYNNMNLCGSEADRKLAIVAPPRVNSCAVRRNRLAILGQEPIALITLY